jgi:hypothetical protein
MCAEKYASRRSWLATALVAFGAVSATRATPTADNNVVGTAGTTRTSSSSVFFATPPASLGVPADFTAQPFFVTDLLKSFYPGFGPTQTSVEPQPVITDPVVRISSDVYLDVELNLSYRRRPSSLSISQTPKQFPQPTS